MPCWPFSSAISQSVWPSAGAKHSVGATVQQELHHVCSAARHRENERSKPSRGIGRIQRIVLKVTIQRLGIFLEDHLDALGQSILNGLHDVHRPTEDQITNLRVAGIVGPSGRSAMVFFLSRSNLGTVL